MVEVEDPRLAPIVARITVHPAFRAAERTPQDPIYHPEGSVGQHLRLVLAEVLLLADANELDPAERLVLALAALTHDLGKAEAYRRSRSRNVYGHEQISASLLAELLPQLDVPSQVGELALEIVELHDRGVSMAKSHPPPGFAAFRRLAARLADPKLYTLFTFADRLGASRDLSVPIWLTQQLRAAGADIPLLRLPDGTVV